MNQPTSNVVSDSWETYVAETEDGPFFVSFDLSVDDANLRASLPFCARVIFPVRHPNESGGPVSPESELLWDLEDQLCALLDQNGIVCRLVGRVTFGGSRELVFQLSERNSFTPMVAYWIQQQNEYAVEVSEHQGWEFFDDLIWPSEEDWSFIGDRNVVQGLVDAGSNPDKEHELEFVFTGSPLALQSIAVALQVKGYLPHSAYNANAGRIVMVKKMLLDVFSIFDETMENRNLAEGNGATYDGWGAAVVK